MAKRLSTPTPTVTPGPSFNEQITEIIGRLAKTARLDVSPSPPVEVYQEVTFTIVPNLPGANIEYRFNFGDRSPLERTSKPRTAHAYRSTGKYQASVEIGVGERKLDVPGPWILVAPRSSPTPSPVVVTPTPVITPSPANQPTLGVSPSTRVEVGQRIWFKVLPEPRPDIEVQYNFDFGDRSANMQTNDPQTPYAYFSPGRYRASVEIRLRGGRSSLPKILGPLVQVSSPSSPSPANTATSVPATASPYSSSPTATATAVTSITASPPTSPIASPTATWSPHVRNTATPTPVVSEGGPPPENTPWIYYMVGAGLAAAAALYGILKLIKPTFRLHWNRDEPQRPLENLTINFELHFHSNVSAGQDRLDVPGANLILARRTI